MHLWETENSAVWVHTGAVHQPFLPQHSLPQCKWCWFSYLLHRKGVQGLCHHLWTTSYSYRHTGRGLWECGGITRRVRRCGRAVGLQVAPVTSHYPWLQKAHEHEYSHTEDTVLATVVGKAGQASLCTWAHLVWTVWCWEAPLPTPVPGSLQTTAHRKNHLHFHIKHFSKKEFLAFYYRPFHLCFVSFSFVFPIFHTSV